MASTGEVAASGAPLQINEERNERRQLLAAASRVAGAVIAVAMVGALVVNPRWPAPDYMLVSAMFIFMAFGQALQLLRRLAPFVGMLVAYGLFGGIAPSLVARASYRWMAEFGLWLTGGDELPIAMLQRWLWQGAPSWYDRMFYCAYMLHFIFPVLLIVLAWKLRPSLHGLVLGSYLTLTSAAFVTFLLFPTAPPWMAAEQGVIPGIVRVSDQVFETMHFETAPTLWTQMAPNPVAAVPSLHTAYAVLLVLLLWKMFGRWWALLGVPYLVIIMVGTVYTGEHYLIDLLLGAVFAGLSFLAVNAITSYRAAAPQAGEGSQARLYDQVRAALEVARCTTPNGQMRPDNRVPQEAIREWSQRVADDELAQSRHLLEQMDRESLTDRDIGVLTMLARRWVA